MHYLSMAFIVGEPLSTLVQSYAKKPFREAGTLVHTLALALHYAHENEIIHRDLKPNNVMIEKRTGNPIIVDFGLAFLGDTTRFTGRGEVFGTLHYMPPEQARGETEKLDSPQVDVYSLGAVLYELLTGRTPFQGSPASLYTQVLNSDPAPPSKYRDELAPTVDAVCLKAMAKGPEDRFRTMADFAKSLAELLDLPTASPIQALEAVEGKEGQGAKLSTVAPAGMRPATASPDTAPPTFSPPMSASLTVGPGGEMPCFTGHADKVYSVAFSPNGRYAVSGSRDATIRLWRIADHHWSRCLIGHKGGVRSVAFFPDSQRLLSGGFDGTVRIWDVDSGEEIGQLVGCNSWVTCVAVSHDGHLVLAGTADGVVRLWSVDQPREPQRLKGSHSDQIRGITFSSTDQYILTAGLDRNVRLWKVQTRSDVPPSRQHLDWVYSVASSSTCDGEAAVSGCADGAIRFWPVAQQDGHCLIVGRHEGSVYSVGFVPHGSRILSGGADGTVQLWENPEARVPCWQGRHGSPVLSVACSSDGLLALSGGCDKSVRLWRLPNRGPSRPEVDSSQQREQR